MTAHAYDNEFFDYVEIGARRSARRFIPLLLEHFTLHSVLDVGCGRGVWLNEWQQQGVTDICGIDGDYVDLNKLDIPKNRFKAANLAEPLHLGRKFDLVQSLEVAEHIPANHADTFVENLVAHGDLVLFSAAPPGQGGEFHVNEQEYSYWRDKFARHHYYLIDFMRPLVIAQGDIEPWYRYNTLVFVNTQSLPSLPAHLRASMADPQAPVADYAPLSWRIRRAIFRRLPALAVNWLVAIKHYAVLRLYQLNRWRQRPPHH